MAKELMACVRIPASIKEYYAALGTDRLRSLGWNEQAIRAGMNTDFGNMEAEIMISFVPGKWYSLKEIKSSLQEIYDRYWYARTAKATDLMSYMTCNEKKVTLATGKREKGYVVRPKACP